LSLATRDRTCPLRRRQPLALRQREDLKAKDRSQVSARREASGDARDHASLLRNAAHESCRWPRRTKPTRSSSGRVAPPALTGLLVEACPSACSTARRAVSPADPRHMMQGLPAGERARSAHPADARRDRACRTGPTVHVLAGASRDIRAQGVLTASPMTRSGGVPVFRAITSPGANGRVDIDYPTASRSRRDGRAGRSSRTRHTSAWPGRRVAAFRARFPGWPTRGRSGISHDLPRASGSGAKETSMDRPFHGGCAPVQPSVSICFPPQRLSVPGWRSSS